MNLNGKICQKLCALCESIDMNYYVNSSELHGLCNNCAKALTGLKIKCTHCESNITIEFLKEVPPPKKCDRCNTIPAKKCQAKKHKFCSECRKSFYQCPSCFCSLCQKPSCDISICNFHTLCNFCSKKITNTCFSCKCQICNKDNPKFQFLGCNHPICDMCIKDSICLICEKKCTYCGKTCDVGKPKCKKHPYCKDCENKLIIKINCCPECQGKTNKYRCFICKTPRAETKPLCSNLRHAMCEDCILLKKACECIKCYGCEKLSECKPAPECKHLVCSTCIIGKKCKKCFKLCPCHVCGKPTEKIKTFACKKHSACDECLGNKTECKTCAKLCNGCNKQKYDCRKIYCEHYNCGKCLSNNNGKCLLCSNCNNCKKKFNDPKEIANGIMCIYCFSRYKFINEDPCIMCRSVINVKNAQCHHSFCEKCFKEWSVRCPPCNMCRGCKNIIGNIINKSGHLVCDACFKENKCCMQCMAEKKCINCGVLAKKLTKYKCGIHKACKRCMKKSFCPCAQKCTNCQENDIGESLSCLHFLCKNCKQKYPECVKQSICLLCMKKCFLCKDFKNLTKNKCEKLEHILCSFCNPFENVEGCKACMDNLVYKECLKCKKKNYTYKLNCSEHRLCINCKEKDSNSCPQCTTVCFECKSQSQINEKLNCSHYLCKFCKDKHIQNCKLYSNTLCQVCSINQYEEIFSCLHKICKNCLIDKSFCPVCFSDCEACNLDKRVYKNCAHRLCSDCLEDHNQCVVCKKNPDFFCDFCKKYKFKLQITLQCGHKKCSDCKNSMFSSPECDISICHYCKKCSKSCKFSAPCKNLVCSNCKKYSDLETCPKCSKLVTGLCTFCKSPQKEYGIRFDQFNFSCVFCDLQPCKQQCQLCKNPECFVERCRHICNECLKTYISCPFCRGFVLCNSQSHVIPSGSECKMCLQLLCSRCNITATVLVEGKLCKNCFKDKRECTNCNKEYFITEIQGIQNETIEDKNLCSMCLKMICLLCHEINEELLDTSHKICQNCIIKTNSRTQGLSFESDSMLKGHTDFVCPEFFICKICETPTQKSLLLLMKPDEAQKQYCPQCLKLQQCDKCKKFLSVDDMANDSECISCAGLEVCQTCKKYEFSKFLNESFKCLECASLELCLNCSKLYPKEHLDDNSICFECLRCDNHMIKNESEYLEHNGTNEFDYLENNENNEHNENCLQKTCDFCHDIYTADTEKDFGYCLSCSQYKCQKCYKITNKTKLDCNGICLECSNMPCLYCGVMTITQIYDMNWGFCINCSDKVCCSCFSNENLIKMKCLHFECRDCRVPYSDQCSKCMRKFTCHKHEVVSNISTDDRLYIFMSCCYGYFCLKCKTKYNGDYIIHKGYCQG